MTRIRANTYESNTQAIRHPSHKINKARKRIRAACRRATTPKRNSAKWSFEITASCIGFLPATPHRTQKQGHSLLRMFGAAGMQSAEQAVVAHEHKQNKQPRPINASFNIHSRSTEKAESLSATPQAPESGLPSNEQQDFRTNVSSINSHKREEQQTQLRRQQD